MGIRRPLLIPEGALRFALDPSADAGDLSLRPESKKALNVASASAPISGLYSVDCDESVARDLAAFFEAAARRLLHLPDNEKHVLGAECHKAARVCESCS